MLLQRKPTIITITGFKTNYLKTNLLKQIKVNTFTIHMDSIFFAKIRIIIIITMKNGGKNIKHLHFLLL
ncbi:hypothetical protein CIK94_08775 [Prevotella sp. P4-51]|nr:hypothetical protein CIK94_08775 [Prevotella sp. P4-51]